jgi:hypothetical protein
MTRAELIAKIRFLFSDTQTANQIFRESLTTRPGNVIDGNNRIFFLLNKRIALIDSIYDADNTIIDPAGYVLTPATGKLVFTLPPAQRLYVDYSWQKLTDLEINEAIAIAAASGNFDPDAVSEANMDYAIHYAVSSCYLAAASKAAEYYTLSAAGKQVSKSEIYNHYVQLAEKFSVSALKLRTDQRTERGDRDIPAGLDSASDVSNPYFPRDGGY